MSVEDWMRKLRSNDGSVLFEFSLIVPVVFLLLSGMVDLGLLFQTAMQVQDAAASAGQYATLASVNNLSAGGNQAQTQSWAYYDLTNTSALEQVGNIQIAAQNVITTSSSGIPTAYVQVTVTGTYSIFLGFSTDIAGTVVHLKGFSQYRVPYPLR